MEAKKKGNAALSSGNFREAVDHFTDAIKYESYNYILYYNRYTGYFCMHMFQRALDDANRTIELKPNWAKVGNREIM